MLGPLLPSLKELPWRGGVIGTCGRVAALPDMNRGRAAAELSDAGTEREIGGWKVDSGG